MGRGKEPKLTRRKFLRLAATTAAGLGLVPHRLDHPFGHAAEDPGGEESGPFSFGCAIGDVTPGSAVVWLRADSESNVLVRYGQSAAGDDFHSSPAVQVTSASDFTAKVSLGGLKPATTYYYRAAVAGGPEGSLGRFVTAPAPEDTKTVRFAFSGDSREWYQPFSILDSVRLSRPDFFIHLGDTIYADRDWVATELNEFWAKYKANRKDPPTRRLLAETSLYVTWDDHEVENDYYGEHPLAKVGQKAFFDYWPVRQDSEDPHRLYRSFRWGRAAELFLLDTRQYRRPNEDTMLGQKQKEWLLHGLSSSDAWFKFIATSVSFTAPGSDRWGGFPKEREQILRFIAEKKIPGVVIIAADVHYAAVTRVPRSPGLKEVIVGPIAAPLNRLARGAAERFEFFSSQTYSYGLVTVDGGGRPPVAELSIFDEKNSLLYRTKVDLSAGDR